MDYLVHHGILGMKWGVRRTPEQLGHHKQKLDTKHTTSRQVLEKWAIYANSPGRSRNEKTTPLVEKYRSEIYKVQGQQGNRHVVGRLKNGERSFNEKSFEKNQLSARQAARIVNKGHDWLDDLSGAMLEDMGYENTKESRAWLKSQPWMEDLWTPTAA